MFDYKIIPSKSYSIPIICVGNLSMGGNGKTPQTEYLINLLKQKNKIAVLSRGYGRKGKGFHYVKTTNTAEQVGDEPLLIKYLHPEIIVAVEIKRNYGIQKIINNHPDIDVIILDDGFQYRSINAGLNILLTSYYNPFFNDYLIPFGRLRENKNGVNRADIIIISKCPYNLNPTSKKGMLNKLNISANQNAYISRINYTKIKSLINSNIMHEIHEYSVILVTGIAETEPIIKFIKKNGNTITHIKYPDHYNYSLKDVLNILNKYNKDKSRKKLILTTEKDAIKLRVFKEEFKDTDLYILSIKVEFEEQNKFEKQILEYVEKNKRNS